MSNLLGKWVEIPAMRDEYGLKLYKVAEVNDQTKEVRLINPDPKVPRKGFWLYEAHCIKMSREAAALNNKDYFKKIDEAKKIGVGKPRRRG